MGVIMVGVQKKILDAVRDVHKKEWDKSGLQNKQTLRWPFIWLPWTYFNVNVLINKIARRWMFFVKEGNER